MAITNPLDLTLAKRRYLIVLWIITLLWVLVLISMLSDMFPLWLFGVISFGAFIAAWWCNLKMVSMQNRHRAGLCWKCGNALNGIDPTECPHCISVISPPRY